MKYYIPTSSLNLDNILQAESISPVSFYSKRLKGYKSFEVIEGLKQCNSIVLFDAPVEFVINDPNRYNYPLLIEIDDDNQLAQIIEKVGEHVFVCNTTIMLTPVNCRFYFENEKAYNITIINTKANRAIKYFKDYKILTNSLGLNKIALPEVPLYKGSLSESKETSVDKIKGALYFYLLGQYYRRTPELARQVHLAQEIYNIAAAVKGSPKYAENYVDKFNSLLEEYKKVDEIEKENKSRFFNNMNKDLGRCKFLNKMFIALLQKWGVWEMVKKHLSALWECSYLPSIQHNKTVSEINFSEINTEIQKRIDVALIKHNNELGEPKLDLVTLNDGHLQLSDAPYITLVVNHILDNKITLEELQSNQYGFYMAIMTKVVEHYTETNSKEEWEKSKERDYVNTLSAHIKDRSQSFKLDSIDNLEFVSIAAVILSGLRLKELANLLKKNEVTDYSYSFLIWGAMCGYCELDREDFTKVLNRENYANVYQMLTNTPLHYGKFEEESIKVEEYSTDTSDGMHLLLPILKEVMKDKEQVLILLEKEISKNPVSEISHRVNELLQQKDCKKRPKQCKKVLTVIELINNRHSCETVDKLLDNLELRSKTKRNNIKQLLGLKTEIKQVKSSHPTHIPQKKKVNDSPSLFAYNYTEGTGGRFANEPECSKKSGALMIEDESWWQITADYIIDEKSKKQYFEDVKWFVGNHNETYTDRNKGAVPGRYYGQDRSNKATILRFSKYLENKKSSKYNKIKALYSNIDVSPIIQYLKQRYDNR